MPEEAEMDNLDESLQIQTERSVGTSRAILDDGRRYCAYCPLGHKYVCDCGHNHEDHIRFAGCRNCGCERYSQRLKNTKPGVDKR